MSILVVAPWGNPFGYGDSEQVRWKPAKYRINEFPEDTSKWGKLSEYGEYVEIEEQWRSSMLAIAQYLKRRGWEPRILVVGLDTIATDFSDYNSVLSSAEGRYKNFVEREGYPSSRIEFLVLPGIGSFGEANFRGSPTNGIPLLSLELSKMASAKLDAVIVDTTHGINYLTTLVREEAERFVAFYNMVAKVEGKRQIPLIHLNSEPIPIGVPDASTVPVLNLLLVRVGKPPLDATTLCNESRVKQNEVKLYKMFGRKDPRGSWLKELEECYKSIKMLASKLCSALSYGALLFIAQEVSRSDVEGCLSRLEELLQNVRNREVKGKEVVHEYSLDYRILSSSVYLLNLLLKVLDELEGVRSDGWFSLNGLIRVSKKMPLSNTAGVLFERETQNMWKRMNLLSEGETMLLSELYKHKYDEDKEGALERHFIAHAGFLKNCVEVKRAGEDLLVRYVENCLTFEPP